MEAIEHYKQALRLDRGDDIALVGVGNAFMELGELDKAGVSFRAAIQQNPHNHSAYYNLAILLEPEEEYEAAASNLEFACLLDDTFPEAWAARGRLQLLIDGDKETAKRFFLRALDLDPQNEALAEEFATTFGEVPHDQD